LTVVVVAIVAIDGAVRAHVSDLAASKAATEIDKALSFIVVKARGMAVVVVVVVVAVVVVVVVVVVVAVVVARVVVVVATDVLFHSIEAFVDVVELDTKMINFHGGCLGGGGGRNERGHKRSRAVGERLGLEGVDAIHFGGVLKEFREGDVGVLKDVSFNQLLQGQRAVINERGLRKLVNCGLGGIIGGIAKEGTQKVLESGQKGGEVASHSQGSEGTTTITSKVVRDILFLEGRGELLVKVTVVRKTAAIEPTSRTRSIQIREGVGGPIVFVNLGKSEVTSDGKEPC
jgi:hypothetical protein